MSAIPKSVLRPQVRPDETPDTVNATFLKFLPAVQTHAKIQFRHLPAADREEAIAEATAAAYLNFRTAHCRGRTHAVTPSTLAHYAVLHARTGRHVGGHADSETDVLSPRAQRRHRFQVRHLPQRWGYVYDCVKDPTSPVWKALLLEDRRTNVADLAAFRLDLSRFLAGQTDRTRTALAMLAAGHKQIEVADRLGLTPSAVCQRIKRAEKEWTAYVGDPSAAESPEQNAQPAADPERNRVPHVRCRKNTQATSRVPTLRVRTVQ